ncbi:MAG: hypothetical protein K5930_09670 [Treponemataceae bacterium]|nr:hypothetical protein [Treponemataceae bacterium]
MKKYIKAAILVFLVAIVLSISGCALFSSFGNVVVGIANGEAGDNSPSFKISAYLYEIQDDGSVKELEKQTANDYTPGTQCNIVFESQIRMGKRVKVFIGLKSRTSAEGALIGVGSGIGNQNPDQVQDAVGDAEGPAHRYFKSEMEFVMAEGVNSPTLPAFREVDPEVDDVWWY